MNTQTRRKFTDSFKLHDEVAIIRTRHGWYDGSIGGEIIKISEYSCLVKGTDGYEYEIEKPRDIVKTY